MGIEILIGKTITNIEKIRNEELIFHCNNGEVYKMLHHQDCCESVYIEDINGSLNNLTGTPILQAEESTNRGENNWGTETWTFYKFATSKGYVTIRWYGESNGYYSEEVSFIKVDEGVE